MPSPTFGPPLVAGWTIVMRALFAGAGGFAGSIALAVMYGVWRSGLHQLTGTNFDLFLFAVVASLAAIVPASLLTAWLQASADRPRFYPTRGSALSHLLLLNLVGLGIFSAMYAFLAFVMTSQIFLITIVAGFLLHALLVLIFTNIIVEEFTRGNFFFDGILGSLVGTIFGIGILLIFSQFGLPIMVGLGMPAMCFSLTLAVGVAESVSAQIYALYGIDVTEVRQVGGEEE